MFNTCSVIKARAKIPLSTHAPLFGSFGVPFNCFNWVFLDTFSTFIAHAEVILSMGMTLFCCFGVPFNRFGKVLFSLYTIFITISKFELGFSVSLFGNIFQLSGRNYIISYTLIFLAIFHVSKL